MQRNGRTELPVSTLEPILLRQRHDSVQCEDVYVHGHTFFFFKFSLAFMEILCI